MDANKRNAGQLSDIARKLALLEMRIKQMKGLSEDYCSRVDHYISEREVKKTSRGKKEEKKERSHLGMSPEVVEIKKKKRGPIYIYDGFQNFRYIWSWNTDGRKRRVWTMYMTDDDDSKKIEDTTETKWNDIKETFHM